MATRKELRQVLDILTLGAAAPVRESLRAAAAERSDAARPWTSSPGIQGLGISRKKTDGEQLETLALKVYVDRKRPESKLDHVVPKTVQVPGREEPVLTDVEEIGVVERELDTIRHRPAFPGCGLGHTAITVGTFGCLVRKQGQSEPLYILSNSHVLANEGAAKKGDKIIQPGDFDDGESPADDIATLHEWVPFQFTGEGTFPNLVDAAIAKVAKSKVKAAIPIIGVPKGVSKTLRAGMKVRKVGRTTGYTIGEITDIDYRFALDYKKPTGAGTGRVGFRDQVLCTRYTAGGDSGSLVCNMSGKAVGLHFAGSPSTSIFHPISFVLDALAIELVTKEL